MEPKRIAPANAWVIKLFDKDLTVANGLLVHYVMRVCTLTYFDAYLYRSDTIFISPPIIIILFYVVRLISQYGMIMYSNTVPKAPYKSPFESSVQ